MSDVAIAAIIAALTSAGVMGLIQFFVTRHDRKKAEASAETKALRYIMLYIIQERGKEHLIDGQITLEDKRAIHKWHELYHEGLGGNGDADLLMKQVDALPLKLDKKED